ncbi:MAG TPA: hypothetical protein DGT23_26290 [Micromonosporaceae bacterium]|nr:hypothetical protein [Micromonosporaceae bacterium]
MRLSTMVRLAWTGNRADWFRLVFTAVGAGLGTFILLAAATVYWLPATERITEFRGSTITEMFDYRYTTSLLNETVRRPWLAAALLLLVLPALVFAGQSARLGAPARDRRLAAIRLAGATPGQTRLIAIVEAVVACLAGALLGIGGYFVIRRIAHQPVLSDPIAEEIGFGPANPTPHLPFPTDALPPLWIFPAVAAAIPVAAAIFTMIALRRVTVTPLTVTRRLRVRQLRWWPLALIVVGFGVLGMHYTVGRKGLGDQDILLPLTAWSAVFSLIVGIALCTAPLGQLMARITRRYAQRPAPLLAARWILADPWSGSRSLAVALISVLAGATSIRALAYFRAQNEAAQGRISGLLTETGLHRFGVLVLVMTLLIAAGGLLFAMVEGLLTRRRALVSLVAAGTPRSVLARAVLWQALLPAVPAVLLAIAVGVTAVATAETQRLPVDPAWVQLASLAGGAIAAIAAAATLSLLVLRAATAVSELRTE